MKPITAQRLMTGIARVLGHEGRTERLDDREQQDDETPTWRTRVPGGIVHCSSFFCPQHFGGLHLDRRWTALGPVHRLLPRRDQFERG